MDVRERLLIGRQCTAATDAARSRPFDPATGERRGPTFEPSQRLEIEAEVGFVVGTPSKLGRPVSLSALPEHVFGVCLVNDWSARDLQAWEYVPLGPFLGKSFLTSVSPFELPDGTSRTFLEDGDVVTLTATAPGRGGSRISLGEVTGRIDSAPTPSAHPPAPLTAPVAHPGGAR